MKDKTKTNKGNIFKIIGIIFYVVAFVMLVFGIFQFVMGGIKGIRDISPFDMAFSFEVMFSSFLGLFVQAVVFFFIGSVFLSIGKAINKRESLEIHDDSDSSNDLFVNLKSFQEKEPKQKHVFCAYCGNELDQNQKKCPYCGASKKISK